MHEQDLLNAFLKPDAPDVFGSVQGPNQIWEPDPFDVEDIHDRARDVFEQTFERVRSAEDATPGRTLLLLGDAGCGKTHLLRAFRASVQERNRGAFAYLHLRTAVSDYRRYLVGHVVDSLSRHYNQARQESGLQRLSHALAAMCLDPVLSNLEAPENLGAEGVQQTVVYAADALLTLPALAGVDPQFLRALLFLQLKGDPRYQAAVVSWLRCQDLARPERELLGVVTPRLGDDDPVRTLRELAQVVRATGGALVIAVDQMEDSYDPDEPGAPGIRRVIEALRDVSERSPGTLVVLSCLHDFWTAQRQLLTQPLIQRIENDPRPVELENLRSEAEVVELLRRRLEWLYEEQNLALDPARPTFPFPEEKVRGLAQLKTRQVLLAFKEWRERALEEGALPSRFPLEAPSTPPLSRRPRRDLDSAWSDAAGSWAGTVPTDPHELISLLHSIASTLGEEGVVATVSREEDRLVIQTDDGTRVVGVCNKNSQGGGLKRELEALQANLRGRPGVVLRSTEFPAGKAAQANQVLAQIKRSGGSSFVYEDSEVRQVLAFRDFLARTADPGLAEWRRTARPMSSLRLFHQGLGLAPRPDAARPRPPAPPPPPQVAPRTGPQSAVPARGDSVHLGLTTGVRADPLALPIADFTRHAAVLGATGSGKTTLALSIIEQLLGQGVSAILIDRKGDLAGYARQDLPEELKALLRGVELNLYTPGESHGAPLVLPLIPDRGLLRPGELADAAEAAASALGGMLNYREAQANLKVMLSQAVQVLLESSDGPVDLERILHLIESQDDAFLARVQRYDARLQRRLIDNLETLRHKARKLLATDGAQVDLATMLGRGARPRLTVISTKFLEVDESIFFVAQLLTALLRWGSRNPSDKLQAVVLLDEADIYLPALREPASKGRVMDLLRRGRSLGLGMILATQNPGDLDYRGRENINTWLLGKITEANSLNKLRPLLTEAHAGTYLDKLAGFATGNFLLARSSQPATFKAQPSLLRTAQLDEDTIRALAASQRGA